MHHSQVHLFENFAMLCVPLSEAGWYHWCPLGQLNLSSRLRRETGTRQLIGRVGVVVKWQMAETLWPFGVIWGKSSGHTAIERKKNVGL